MDLSSPLSKTLGTNGSFQVDIGVLLLRAHRLVVLARPLFNVMSLLSKIRRWDGSGLTPFILIMVNGTSFFLPNGYILSLSLGFLILMATLGIVHSQTQILVKVFPNDCLTADDVLVDNQDEPLNHQQLLQYYKSLLHLVDKTILTLTSVLSAAYSVLKWSSVKTSLRWYASTIVLVTCAHLLPLRWTMAMLIDALLLEPIIYNGISNYLRLNDEAKSKSWRDTSDTLSMQSITSVSSSGLSKSLEDDIETMSGTSCDDNTSDSEDSLSEAEAQQSGQPGPVTWEVESPEQEVNSIDTGSTQVSNKPSFYGRGLRSKWAERKKRGEASSGNCLGCQVAFTSILKRRRICTNCGNNFCSRCCNTKIPRAMFGATAPAAQMETVLVCYHCHQMLTSQTTPGENTKHASTNDH